MTPKPLAALLTVVAVLAGAAVAAADPPPVSSVPTPAPDPRQALAGLQPPRIVPSTGGDILSAPGPIRVSTLPSVTGDAAIVIERHSGVVLGSRNADIRRAPASVTKLMTALLAVEAVDAGETTLTTRATAQADVDIEGGNEIELRPGDRVSVRDLLYMALVESGNDAAVMLGTHVGGSRAAFIERMNERAAELGLDDTSFVDISGRDPEDLNDEGRLPAHAGCSGDDFDEAACAHHSTARDLAELARVVLDVPLLAQIVGTDSWTPSGWPAITNTNDLILDDDADFFDGAYGVKTGTSGRAGSNLVSAASRRVCEGDGLCTERDVIAVVLGAADDGTAGGDRFSDSRRLLEFGLARP